MSYKKQNTRSTSYLCTIKLDDKQDIGSLETLKKGVALKRKVLKERGNKRLPIVTVKYRKPQLAYNPSRSNSKYGWGGTVCKRQMPLEADIYIHTRYL
jgi:hypothetical protein